MNFDKAVQIVLKHEGGYVFHSLDPGGETKFGISKRAYPDLDIKKLSEEKAIEIYKKDYWESCACDFLPSKIRLMIFDCAVNQGVSRAIRILQGSLAVNVDGVIGKVTLSSANKINEDQLLKKIIMKRHYEYSKLPQFKTFGAGWMRRLLDITIKSFCMEA